ncbi:MAG: nucleotidyl transferase AbiEii/AbiGii toxin family protein [Deltaproteobacteria bacterium]|nr:nucleotidyl transferase AbiEii/AbiGii toxin family protein [Deltaproteobacteria bacterium]
MKAHLECLPDGAREALKRLKPVAASNGFVLAGGTGLALRLGHRVSNDLDFFTARDFSTAKVFEEIKGLGLSGRVIQEEEGTLTVLAGDTKVSMFRYRYGFLEETETVDGVPVAGVVDIASMKVIAISRQGAKRDFVDLYFILRDAPFWRIAENMVRRFGADRVAPMHIGKALVFFDDAEADPEPLYLSTSKPDWKRIKKFFKDHVRQMVMDLQKAKEAIDPQ